MHANASARKPTLFRSRKLWLSIAGIAAVVLLTAAAALEYEIHNAEPILRKRVIETLSARFQTQAQLADLQISLFHGLGVTGTGLVVPGISTQGQVATPLLSVQRFEFRTSLRSLLRTPTHVDTVYVQGLNFSLPPKENRTAIPPAPTGGDKITLIVHTIVATDAAVILQTNKPNKDPLEFDISKLTLTNVGANQPFHFVADLSNPKPIGDIHSTGNFGPFQHQSPADTPIDGHYTFSNADLSTTKGIAGTLNSTGDYKGQLGSIVVDGETDTPDFSIDIANHPVPLHTNFHAIVDGTSGDVTLAPVHATILHSALTATGSITRTKGVPGHDIELNVAMDHARIEDMLLLGVKTTPPLMNGALAMHTKLSIPPGKISVTKKIKLDGTFTISGATFNTEKFQNKVDMLSLRAQGKPKDANPAGAAANSSVQSQMTGRFQVGDGAINISTLQYDLPGAQVLLNGTYTMDGATFDLTGLVRTKATISHMTTGVKSALLKPVDPFFKKNGAGSQVPIRIHGTKDEPHFGLDLHDKDHKPDTTALPPPPK